MGRQLDGTEELLSAYRGRVLLIDFWATWCAPCIDALPELREMVADLPADRFALLAVSVDEELETVTACMERETMPWYNWHLGRSSDLERILDVRGFPTYLLADENGRVLSNGDNSLAQLRCMAERAVAGEAPDCPAAERLGSTICDSGFQEVDGRGVSKGMRTDVLPGRRAEAVRMAGVATHDLVDPEA